MKLLRWLVGGVQRARHMCIGAKGEELSCIGSP